MQESAKGKHFMLLHRTQTHMRDRTSFCQWCVKTGPVGSFFKVRDGPLDWHFCDVRHTELWLEYRHRPETFKLCKMLPKERIAHLKGASMEDEISRLFPGELCELKAS